MAKDFLFVDANGDYTEANAYDTADFINVSTGVPDAAKPIVLDAAGKIDPSMINMSAIDHGSLGGLGDDDHVQYLLVDGTRAMAAALDMGSFQIQNLADPTAAQHAVTKAYADAVATGLRPHGNVAVATTANITLSGLQTIDTYLTIAGDRVLVKDQTDPKENGVYVAAAGAWVRSEDLDNAPLAEIVNGVFIPKVLNGSVNLGSPFVISSVGTGVNDLHIIGTDNIVFTLFTSPTVLTEGNGIDIASNVISVEILAAAGLKFVGTSLSIEPADFAGLGLVDDGFDNLAIDFSTLFNDQKAVAAQDINSTINGEGASIVGIEDSGAYYTGTSVEAALAELDAQLGGLTSSTFGFTEDNVLTDNDPVYSALDKLDLKFGDLASQATGEGASLVGIEDAAGSFTSTNVEGALIELFDLASVSTGEYALAGAAGVTKGDLLYYSAADTVLPLPITASHRAIGVALETAASGASVQYAAHDELVGGIIAGGVAGTRYYWDGSALTTTIPAASGSFVHAVGIAKNATDLLLKVDFIKKNT